MNEMFIEKDMFVGKVLGCLPDLHISGYEKNIRTKKMQLHLT